MSPDRGLSRRQTLLSLSALALSGCLGDDEESAETPEPTVTPTPEASPTETPEPTYVDPAEEPEYDGWFTDVEEFEGTIDERGYDLVFVTIRENWFEPPAIMVEPGTTVDWGWGAETGDVTITHENGAFDREVGGRGYERVFEDPGVFRYYSKQQREEGMKGAVVVDE